MTASLNVLAISGSLRARSYNTALLHATAAQAPAGTVFRFAAIADLPLYNADLNDGAMPEAAKTLVEQVAAADAVVIATPEYNYSVPGGLKNALDWVSRAKPQPFAGKPVAIMGASPGVLGTARAQYHLRQIFVFLDAFVLNKPEVFVGGAAGKFDQDLTLTDGPTAEILGTQMRALADLVALVKR